MKDKLNMTYYSGQDLYSDGDVEQELLRAVEDHEDIEQCLMEGNSWPFLYHMSNIRENILDWYDFDPKGSLLEIGSGCGALTGLFCRKVDHVVAIELSKQRSMINATRNEQYDNLTIMLGNFEDIKIEEKFDYVTLIGVFEYSISYISSDDPFMDMLKKIKGFLKPGGKLFLAIENKYGLKYFAGATEDHTGRCFDGLQNYATVDRVRTFSHKTLEKMLVAAGFFQNEFYYPMPDYKLPSEIYSDRCLPSMGSIRGACVAYDRDRYELLDERLVFDSLCEDGMFGDFANSFLVVSSMKHADDGESYEQEIVEYAKYNRLRAPRFQISTRILACKNENGTVIRRVEKQALREEANAHINRLSKNRQKLLAAGVMQGESSLHATEMAYQVPVLAEIISEENGRVVFPYVEGINLAKKVNACLGNKEKLLAAMRDAVDRIYNAAERSGKLSDFKMTEKFGRVFGRQDELEIRILESMESYPASNIDSILSNFVIRPDGSLVCLDYEWVFPFPVPVDYLKYRTVFYYFSENRAYIEKDILEKDFLAEFGLTEQEIRVFQRMDEHFQQYVHGKNRKYAYTSNYEKQTFNIGTNLRGGEQWFRGIAEDINRLNQQMGDHRRDLVECHVKMHRKSEYLEEHEELQRKVEWVQRKWNRVKRIYHKLAGTQEK